MCERGECFFIFKVHVENSNLITFSHLFTGLQLKMAACIIPRKPSERDNHSPYHRVSFRSVARTKIDEIISGSPNNYEEFLRLLTGAGYEIKSGKHVSIRGAGQKRFIRLRSLGKGYSEEEIRKRINVEDESDQRAERPKREFDFLIDINKKMKEGKGRGYERWAKVYNVKQVSKALLYLQEHGIKDYEDLAKKAKGRALLANTERRHMKTA